jgi:hypothetical protein
MRPEAAKTVKELANMSKAAVDYVIDELRKHEINGYIKSYSDVGGDKKFYLTETGIIRVCSFFT